MATSEHRTVIILPPEERALAEAIRDDLARRMGSSGGLSGAIRAAIRAYARELGIVAIVPKKAIGTRIGRGVRKGTA